MTEYEYPTTDDGDLDYQAMVEDLAIAEFRPWAPVFICNNTGEPTQVVATDLEVGNARLRDPFGGEEWTVDIAELWADWRYDDLHYVERAFVHDHEVVVDRIALATLADHADETLRSLPVSGQEAKDLQVAVGSAYDALGHLPEEDEESRRD